MANQQWDNQIVHIPDDSEGEYYDPRDVKPIISISKSNINYEIKHDDDGYFDDSRRNQLYWTTDATKALIKFRGELEPEFEQGGASKSLLWVKICKKMNELGYDLTPEKVSKKWHNIMITYNKNIRKKVQTGVVNWGFFEDIDMYFKHKREQGPVNEYPSESESPVTITPVCAQIPLVAQVPASIPDSSQASMPRRSPAPTTNKRKYSEDEEFSNFYDNQKSSEKDFIHSSLIESSIAEPQIHLKEFAKKFKFHNVGNLENDDIDSDDIDPEWWKEYFQKRLDLEKEKMKREQDRHKDYMNFQKMALMLQEKVEKIKVDAINNLTNAITRLADNKVINNKK